MADHSPAAQNSNDGLIVAGLLAIVLIALLYFFHDRLYAVINYIRLAELQLLSLFNPAADEIIAWIRQTPRELVEWKQVSAIGSWTGSYLRWPTAVLGLIGAAVVIKKRPDLRYRRNLSLEKFISAQAAVWPAIQPITKVNPATAPGDSWAPALTPIEWARKHGLVKEDSIPKKPDILAALALQLTDLWRGPAVLSPHKAAVYALFILKGNRMQADYEALIARLAGLFTSMKPDMVFGEVIQGDVEARRLIRLALASGAVKAAEEATLHHAYVETAMIAVLKWARARGGVLVTSDFLWLKAVDRNLYYVLNSVGRRAVHMEAAGAIAHYLAEMHTGRSMIDPYLEEAYIGFIEQLSKDGHLD